MEQEEITPSGFVCRFDALTGALGIDSKEWFADYDINRDNNIHGLQQVIDRIDSDIRQEIQENVFDEYGDITAYGEDLAFARFCMIWLYGYFKSEEGQKSFRDVSRHDDSRVKASYLAYAAYWHLGEDFLLGNIIENILREIMRFDLFRERHKTKRPTQIHKKMCAIADEIEDLFRQHYNPKHNPHMRAFSAIEPGPKPEFLPMFGVTEKT